MLFRDFRDISKDNTRKSNNVGPVMRPSTSEKYITHQYYTSTTDNYIRVGAYKFKQDDLIGKGFSSRVYKAINIHQNNNNNLNNSNKHYAIKVINLKKFKNTQMLDKQIEISKQLDHPNLVKFYQHYKTNQYYYIVTEYCDDGDLAQYIKRKRGGICEREADGIMRQLIAGCLYLFRKNILHRDLKPANIMKMGENWKIGDFGFSTYCRQEAIFDRVNVGTPLYMPLQALKLNKYSFKSDIFALGVILHEILTAKTPWPCKTEKQLLQKMKNIPLPKLQNVGDQKIVAFYQKACQIDQNCRLRVTGLQQFLNQPTQFQLIPQPLPLKKSHSSTNIPNSTTRHSLKTLNTLNTLTICQNQQQNQKPITTTTTTTTTTTNTTTTTQQNKKSIKNHLMKPMTPTNLNLHSVRNLGSMTNLHGGGSKIKIDYCRVNRDKVTSRKESNSYRRESTIKNTKGQCQSTEISQQQSQKLISNQSIKTIQLKYLKIKPKSTITSITQKSIFNKNTRFLLNQLQFCRLAYYMIKNIRHVSLSPHNLAPYLSVNKVQNTQSNHKMFLTLTLFKNLLRCIKQLQQPQNYFNTVLQANTTTTNSYYQSRQYKSLEKQIKNYATRYEKQYLDILKNTDIAIIRAVNRKFPQLSYTTAFGHQFYSNLLQYFGAVLRSCSDQLESKLQVQGEGIIGNCLGTLLTDKKYTNANLQYLESLYLFCRILKYKKGKSTTTTTTTNKSIQNQDDIMNEIGNKIVLDYSKSKCTLGLYYELRDRVLEI